MGFGGLDARHDGESAQLDGHLNGQVLSSVALPRDHNRRTLRLDDPISPAQAFFLRVSSSQAGDWVDMGPKAVKGSYANGVYELMRVTETRRKVFDCWRLSHSDLSQDNPMRF